MLFGCGVPVASASALYEPGAAMNDPAPQAPALALTIREAAAALRLSERTIFRIIRRGELPFVKIGTSLRIMPDDLVAFVQKHRAAPPGVTPTGDTS